MTYDEVYTQALEDGRKKIEAHRRSRPSNREPLSRGLSVDQRIDKLRDGLTYKHDNRYGAPTAGRAHPLRKSRGTCTS